VVIRAAADELDECVVGPGPAAELQAARAKLAATNRSVSRRTECVRCRPLPDVKAFTRHHSRT